MNQDKSDQFWLTTYPEWFAPTFPKKYESMLEKFKRVLKAAPNQACIYYFDTALTFAGVNRLAVALAAALADNNVGKGDRVLFVLQNIPQAIVASLAVWMRGAIVVPVNPMCTAKDLKHLLEDSGACWIVCEDGLFEKSVAPATTDQAVITTSPLDLMDPDSRVPDQLRTIQKLKFDQTRDFMELVQSGTGQTFEEISPAPDDLAYLVYTSGTTGPPKGAMVSHANIDHNCYVYEAAARLDRSDVIMGVAPLFHITGIVAHQATAFHLGIPVVLCNRFEAGDMLRLIEKYKATFTVAAITVYIALLHHPELQSFDISSFQKAYSGGAPVSPGAVEKVKKAMGLAIYNAYGLTESASPATITPLGLAGPVDDSSGAFSVGMIIPGIEAWVVDVDHPDTILPPGQEGELVLRGPSVVSGYWKKPEETANAIKDNRFFTGDVAKFDGQGWCFIVDRKKDLINVSGYKVWPRDVEDVLYQHPGVKEAAVVGVPDDYRGETVKAFVSIADDAEGKVTCDELIQFCKERLAAYKYPRLVEIIEEVPKTLTGKPLRRELRPE